MFNDKDARFSSFPVASSVRPGRGAAAAALDPDRLIVVLLRWLKVMTTILACMATTLGALLLTLTPVDPKRDASTWYGISKACV